MFDKDPISQVTVFETIWTDTPEEVIEEVRELWVTMEFGNDDYYYTWGKEEDSEEWPIIAAYLESRGIENCLIHFWW